MAHLLYHSLWERSKISGQRLGAKIAFKYEWAEIDQLKDRRVQSLASWKIDKYKELMVHRWAART